MLTQTYIQAEPTEQQLPMKFYRIAVRNVYEGFLSSSKTSLTAT